VKVTDVDGKPGCTRATVMNSGAQGGRFRQAGQEWGRRAGQGSLHSRKAGFAWVDSSLVREVAGEFVLSGASARCNSKSADTKARQVCMGVHTLWLLPIQRQNQRGRLSLSEIRKQSVLKVAHANHDFRLCKDP